jgi:hypothetical protein
MPMTSLLVQPLPQSASAARVFLRRGLLASLVALTTLSALGGCQVKTDPTLGGPAYPDDKSQDNTLDIQVVRSGERVRLTNTTPRAFGKSRIWINRWFSRDIDALDVGQTLEFNLSEFRDQYGEPFKGGGFFATERPEGLSQAQLETADGLVGLVVVSRGNE